MADISLVIINDEGAEYLPRLLDSIREQAAIPDIEYILIDNYSRDNSVSRASELGVREIFQFQQKVENRGVLYNKGYELASSPYILFIHSDAYFFCDFFQKLKEKLNSHAPDGLVMFTQYYPDFNLIGPERIGIDVDSGSLYYWQIFRKYPEHVEWLLEFTEACFLANREVFDKIAFDETFHNSFYEHVLADRVRDMGRNVESYEECKFGHYFIELHEKLKTYNTDIALIAEKISGLLIMKSSVWLKERDNLMREVSRQAEIMEQMRLKNRAKRLIKKFIMYDLFLGK